jgi:hypothetical protein
MLATAETEIGRPPADAHNQATESSFESVTAHRCVTSDKLTFTRLELYSFNLSFLGRRKMTAEEREKMNDLCKQIQTGKNPEIFDQLVRDLNELLEIKHGRIHPEHTSNPSR